MAKLSLATAHPHLLPAVPRESPDQLFDFHVGWRGVPARARFSRNAGEAIGCAKRSAAHRSRLLSNWHLVRFALLSTPYKLRFYLLFVVKSPAVDQNVTVAKR